MRPQPSTTASSTDTERHHTHFYSVNDPHHPLHWKFVWKRRLILWSRWLHIYLSMACFAIVLFFAVTGLTLNHPDWFAKQERTLQKEGGVDIRWLKPEVDKPRIMEYLRRGGVKGALSDLRVDDSQVSASFKGPGYSCDASIDRDTGKYELTETKMGFAAMLNDLHKGRDSGPAWSRLIDISAAMLALISMTGLIILFFLARRKVSGLVALAVGALICYLVYWIFVP